MRLAVIELRAPATRTRSLAIAATGAVAVFGSVAIQGAHGNLQAGLDRTAADMNRVSDVWVSVAGTANTLATTPFASDSAARLQSCRACNLSGSTVADSCNIGDRLAWMIAPPRGRPTLIPASQLLQGNPALANRACGRADGPSSRRRSPLNTICSIGDSFTLPSPRPASFRVAALSTNIGWPSGAVVINSTDYAQAWGSNDTSAYNIALKPGVSPARGGGEVARALGPHSGLVVQTASAARSAVAGKQPPRARAALADRAVRPDRGGARDGGSDGRDDLAAPSALAYLKRQGYRRGVLWRALLYESALLLGASCTIGAVFGLYGQLLLSHALQSVTGFPVVFSVAAPLALWSIALVSVAAAGMAALPGYLATRVTASVNPG